MLAGHFQNPSAIMQAGMVMSHIDPNATAYVDDPNMGYVAPPLVALFLKPGLLHNRSVPTARTLLCKDPEGRPTRWRWKGEPGAFAEEALETSPPNGAGDVYDTQRRGLRNRGQDYCDAPKEDPSARKGLSE